MVEIDIFSTFMTDPLGITLALIFAAGMIYKGYQANGLTGALDAVKAAFSKGSNVMTVPKELMDTPDIWKMSEATKKIIFAHLPGAEQAKLSKIIDEYENANPPILYYKLATSKGMYEILNGGITDVEGLDTISIGTTVDACKGAEIFRVWGGNSASAGNIPKRQDTEFKMEMTNRSVFVSIKPADDTGGLTLGLFADGKLFAKKIVNIGANDIHTANEISFPTYEFTVPKEIVQEARETDQKYDLVVALAAGGKWYYQSDVSLIPWEKSFSITVTAPALTE